MSHKCRDSFGLKIYEAMNIDGFIQNTSFVMTAVVSIPFT